MVPEAIGALREARRQQRAADRVHRVVGRPGARQRMLRIVEHGDAPALALQQALHHQPHHRVVVDVQHMLALAHAPELLVLGVNILARVLFRNKSSA